MHTYIEYVHARPEFEELLVQLSEANHFTAADLESNRRGRIGSAQFVHQMREALESPLLVLLGCLAVSVLVRITFAGYVEKQSVFAFVDGLLGAMFTLHFDKFRDLYFLSHGERLPIIVTAFVVSAPAFAYKKLRHIPFNRIMDLLAGRVTEQAGQVYKTSEEKNAPGRAGKKGETIEIYYYLINGEKIEVTGSGHNALSLGLTYRVYFLPRSKTLLSIEPIVRS